MAIPIFNQVNRLTNHLALKGLEKAYQGAAAIKAIEDRHFNGNTIAIDSEKGKTVLEYFETQLDQQLMQIRLGLTQFKINSFFSKPQTNTTDLAIVGENNQENEILTKLAFIESVVAKYRSRQHTSEIIDAKIVSIQENQDKSNSAQANQAAAIYANDFLSFKSRLDRIKPSQSNGSLFEAVNQIRKELSPEYEQEVVRELRKLRRQERIAIRWLVLILIIPLIVQITTRNLVFEPLLDQYRDAYPTRVKVSHEISERFLAEFGAYRESLELGELLGLLSEEEKEERLKEKASEVYRLSGYRTLDGLKNLLADGLSLISFVIVVYIGRDKLTFLRSWFNRSFKNLNDVTKVFIFILVTDLFVGFHSVEGWEVIIGGVTGHFGLPESRIFVNTFIATVPVILDSCFKLWVFNYLTRSSPSAVAILEKMNQ